MSDSKQNDQSVSNADARAILVDATAKAVQKINGHANIKELYAAHGITGAEPDAEPTWTRKRATNQERAEIAQYAAQKEIGAPGTNMVDGRIEVEHNPRLYPRWARGRVSRPGVLEEVWRVEPIVFKSSNEITALTSNATYEPAYPEDITAETRDICEKAHRSIMNVKEGMPNTLQNMGTAFRIGFAPFEKRWQTKSDGFVCLYSLAFREQSTVDKWLFDERQSECLGGEFEARTGVTRYVLPRGGGTPATERLLVVNINATGNNIEGVSAVRVSVGLRKLKELLLQISGVSHQKYGVPIAMIIRDMANAGASALAEIGGEANKSELQKVVRSMQNMRASVAPVFDMPPGVSVVYATPTNDMPDVTPLLEYIDTMIALCFHNEGALLGSQSFGSYAMSKTSDSKFMRSAVVPANRIAVAFTELMHDMIRFNHSDPDSIETWPTYTFRFAGTQDASAWTADMKVLVESQVWTWPDEPRRMAAANMGLTVEAFDEWVETAKTAADTGGENPGVEVEATVAPGEEDS